MADASGRSLSERAEGQEFLHENAPLAGWRIELPRESQGGVEPQGRLGGRERIARDSVLRAKGRY